MFTFFLDPPLNPKGVRAGEEPYRPSDAVKDQIIAADFMRSPAASMLDSIRDNFLDPAREYRRGYLKAREDLLRNPVPANLGPSAQQLEYYGADIARRYGMDRNTAYNEAMANTAYQRAVADMQAAGLNPASLFSAGRASAAGSGYASGSSGGYSSGKGASSKDQLPGWIFYGVQGLAQAIGTIATKSFIGGYGISQIAANLMRAYNGR